LLFCRLQLEQFVAHTLQTALSADSMANTHPISVPVKNPSQITEIFDSISYDKVRSSDEGVQKKIISAAQR